MKIAEFEEDIDVVDGVCFYYPSNEEAEGLVVELVGDYLDFVPYNLMKKIFEVAMELNVQIKIA